MAYLGRQPNTGVRSRYIYTATASQTTFSGTDDDGKTLRYEDAAYLDVFLNGVLLKPVTDYAATTKTSVVLTSGAAASDIVEIVAYDIVNIADTVSKANGGTFDAAVTVNGDLTVDTNTLYVDSTNNRVGVGTASPGDKLTLAGTAAYMLIDRSDGEAGVTFKYNSDNTKRADLAVQTNGDLRIKTNLTERMRLLSGGGVAIGTSSSPNNAPLLVHCATDDNIRISQQTHAAIQAVNDSASAFTELKLDGSSLLLNSQSGGNVGIATSTPPRPMSVQLNSNGANFLAYRTSETNGDYGGIEFHNHPSDITNYRKGAIYFRSNGNGFGRGDLVFCIDNAGDNGNVGLGDEKMRLNFGGDFLLGKTANDWTQTGLQYEANNPQIGVTKTQSENNVFLRKNNATGTLVQFWYNSTGIGSITMSSSSVAYNTSSDYRLKENVTELTGAIDRVKQLPVHRFNFIADPDKTVDGFLAHEVQSIVPEAIHGEKDGMKTEEYEVTPAVLDDDGNVVTEAVIGTREVPEYQGIDQAKLVPLLTQALKDAITKIEALEARVATLENA